MSITAEKHHILSLFERVEAIEEVASTLPGVVAVPSAHWVSLPPQPGILAVIWINPLFFLLLSDLNRIYNKIGCVCCPSRGNKDTQSRVAQYFLLLSLLVRL